MTTNPVATAPVPGTVATGFRIDIFKSRGRVGFCLVLFLCSPLFLGFAALAEFNLRDWMKWREINFDFGKKTDHAEFVVFELSAAVGDAAQNDLRDLRVIDEEGKEIASQLFNGIAGPLEGKPGKPGKPMPMPSLGSTFHSYQKKRDDQNEKSQNPGDWLIDLGAKNVLCERLEFVTDAVNFKRSFYVQGSNDEGEGKKWREVGRGEIFDIRVGKTRQQQLTFDCPQTKFRFLCVTILNLDDPPISFRQIRTLGWPQQWLFRREAGKRYRLFYGNARANAPRYDLQHLTAYLKPDQILMSSLGQERNNTDYVAAVPEETKSSQHPVGLWVTIAIAALILLGFIYRLARLSADETKTP
jgi:hypothetical protein